MVKLALGLGRALGVAQPSGRLDQVGQVIGQESADRSVLAGLEARAFRCHSTACSQPDAGVLESFRVQVDRRQVIQGPAHELAKSGDSGCSRTSFWRIANADS